MTLPVEVFPGDALMLTRKVSEERCFLKPTPETRELVAYMAVFWAQRYGILIAVLHLLSNHYHLGIEDPLGLYPKFLEQFNHWVSLVMNRRLGRTGLSLFESRAPGRLRLLDTDAVERKMVYAMCNAVRHGIVPERRQWPGALWDPSMVGQRLTFRRPPELAGSDVFPPTVSIVVPAPKGFENTSPDRVRRRFSRLAARFEREWQERHGPDGFIGRRRAMEIPLEYSTREPRSEPRKEPNPLFATRNADLRRAAVQRRKEFLVRYRAARTAFLDGDRDVVWPPGTYQNRVRYSLPVARSP